MTKLHPENQRIKRRYLHYLREAQGRAETTIDNASRAIADFERFTSSRPFDSFRSADAVKYRNHLLSQGGRRAMQLSNRSTVHTKLAQLERFFRWLADQPGFRRRISYSDVEYFGLSSRDKKLAFRRRERPTPTPEQVTHVIHSMPASTPMELRDRAVMAFIFLTGIRVTALVTLKLKHLQADGRGVDQDAEEVRTKFGKSFPTFFFPVGSEVLELFQGYVAYLREELLWGNDDPLFPCSQVRVGEKRKFEWVGLAREHWKTSEPVRDIFRRAFFAAQVPYFSPHSFRRALTRLGQQLCRSPESMKAWSQNLGHDEVMTTLTSYGAVSHQRQAQLIASMATELPVEDLIARYGQMLNDPLVRGLLDRMQKDI